MIVSDRNIAKVIGATVIGCALMFRPGAASAVETGSATTLESSAERAATVTLDTAGSERSLQTKARTVGDFLAERGIVPGAADYVSPPPGEAVADGMEVTYRPAVPVRLSVDSRLSTLHSTATSVGELLAERHVAFGVRDLIEPPLDAPIPASGFVRVRHVAEWTARVRAAVPPVVTYRSDAHMPLGSTRTIDAGLAGMRVTTYRFARVGGDAPERTAIASRIIRAPRSTVIARGVGTYASLARVATAGFESAVHFAGSALHMIATAYTAACSGCSGVTASGSRAGFGVIAVDPRIIPLGTKLFVPGYGRAVAGDTGGAILGNRIDLGMNSLGDALHFGRRPVTVYLLR